MAAAKRMVPGDFGNDDASGHTLLWMAMLAASGPLLAHHSGAMFDRTSKVTVTGTVVIFQYVHA